MAPTIKEQYFGRDIQFGRDNNTASRVFHVSEAGVGVTIAQTYALEGLPQINDLHPDSNSPGVGKLYASSIARIPVGRSVMVTVSYNSLPFSGVSQIPVNPMAEGYLSVSTSFAFEKVELPAFYLSKIISPAAEGPPVEGFAWDRMEGDFEFEKVVHVFTASLNGDFTSGFSLTDFFAAGAGARRDHPCAAVGGATDRRLCMRARTHTRRPRRRHAARRAQRPPSLLLARSRVKTARSSSRPKAQKPWGAGASQM